MARSVTAGRGPSPNASAQANSLAAELAQLKAVQQFDKDCLDWCEMIKTTLGSKFFHIRQHFSDASDEEYGSTWQRMICHWLKVPEEICQEFWNRPTGGGRAMARLSLNNKKSNVTGAMKLQFEGKCAGTNLHVPGM